MVGQATEHNLYRLDYTRDRNMRRSMLHIIGSCILVFWNTWKDFRNSAERVCNEKESENKSNTFCCCIKSIVGNGNLDITMPSSFSHAGATANQQAVTSILTQLYAKIFKLGWPTMPSCFTFLDPNCAAFLGQPHASFQHRLSSLHRQAILIPQSSLPS